MPCVCFLASFNEVQSGTNFLNLRYVMNMIILDVA